MVPDKIDVSQLFSAYVAFAGDLRKAAAACNVPVAAAEAVAIRERWAEKLPDYALADPGAASAAGTLDLQRQINRAVNYIQAHRLRSIVDRVVLYLAAQPTESLLELLSRRHKQGRELNVRPLADLVKAAEVCQMMTMRALGDLPDAGAQPTASSSVGLLVMNAMKAAETVGLSSTDLVRAEFSSSLQSDSVEESGEEV